MDITVCHYLCFCKNGKHSLIWKHIYHLLIIWHYLVSLNENKQKMYAHIYQINMAMHIGKHQKTKKWDVIWSILLSPIVNKASQWRWHHANEKQINLHLSFLVLFKRAVTYYTGRCGYTPSLWVCVRVCVARTVWFSSWLPKSVFGQGSVTPLLAGGSVDWR